MLTYLQHMSEKVAARLRRHDMTAGYFTVGLRTRDGWLGDKRHLATPDNDGGSLYRLCREVLDQHWCGEGVHQVQVTALDPQPCQQQMDMFSQHSAHSSQLNAVMDDINRRYGELTVAPARLTKRSSMPNVIAPAWKPSGHRQTI
ncbi:MAG TPA: hypothetical protein ENI64_12830 [Gammaproteobacteria bacterium]|nr:hypothetical protein [Gammaproteobacteria bacterium]